MSLVREVELLTLRYARTGGKKNRAIQRKRMILFARFCRDMGCRSLGQVGRRHIEAFFATHQWKEATRYNYKLALRELFEIADHPAPRILDQITYPKLGEDADSATRE